MILCVNLNAAIDKTIVVNSFKLGDIHRPEKVLALAGGKGCNVARALKQFGQSPVVTGWIGGSAGQFIENNLQQEGIATDFVDTGIESRTCTSILDSSNQTLTEIYEKGESIPPDKVEAMLDHFREMVRKVTAVSLSGSLPPGVLQNFYAQLIEIAHESNTPVFLDSSGEALAHGVAAKPFLIKPNEKEIAVLAQRQLNNFADFVAAAADVSVNYSTMVVLSLGANGALAAKEGKVAHVKPPLVNAISAVGSGDCTLAGLMFGFAQSLDWIDATKLGVAAGTANTLITGAGKFSMADFNDILADVEVELIRG
ncbi:MAG: 1-phosphofructokinase family hexose kinase [Ardenticatenaceae bacterium]|nr:1-phosphofructokinase family hexose kinase [Anaerolineales bacterium]MCB8979779.1 1-phosphofructokinase family hexose kinase [Ardenticatenaceae bacterium]